MSVLRLQDRNVLITGAESGIGRATALRAASEGAHIGAIGLDGPALETLVERTTDVGGLLTHFLGFPTDIGCFARDR